MSNVPKNFATWVKKRRELLRIPRRVLAVYTGVDPTVIYKLEKYGYYPISEKDKVRIYSFLEKVYTDYVSFGLSEYNWKYDEWIGNELGKRNITLWNLARKTNLKYITLSFYKQGIRTPKIDPIYKIGIFFKINK